MRDWFSWGGQREEVLKSKENQYNELRDIIGVALNNTIIYCSRLRNFSNRGVQRIHEFSNRLENIVQFYLQSGYDTKKIDNAMSMLQELQNDITKFNPNKYRS